MDGLTNGIMQICSMLQPVAIAVAALAFVILGIETIIGGQEASMKFRQTIKYIIIGSACVFLATTIAKTICGFFGG